MNLARAAGQPRPMVAPIWLTAPASRPDPPDGTVLNVAP